MHKAIITECEVAHDTLFREALYWSDGSRAHQDQATPREHG